MMSVPWSVPPRIATAALPDPCHRRSCVNVATVRMDFGFMRRMSARRYREVDATMQSADRAPRGDR
jgi:hypothetical protein